MIFRDLSTNIAVTNLALEKNVLILRKETQKTPFGMQIVTFWA